MARGVLESRGLTAAGNEVWEEDESMLLPMPGSVAVRRQGRQVRVLGALALGVLVLVGLGSIAHPSLTIARRTIGTEWESKVAVKPSKRMHAVTPDVQSDKSSLKVADDTKAQEEIIVEDDNVNGLPVAGKPGKLDIANREVQELIDTVKAHVRSLLKPQGWNVGLGSFKALTYCKQDVAGLNYVVKVQVADDEVSKVARAGEVLQMTIHTLLGKAPVLTSVQMVARDDTKCFATPLTPPPALPHVVFDATPKVQALCDAVKGKVPKLLKTSGWNLNLAPYQALSYCGDGVNHIVKVKVADGEALLSEYPDGLFLQLLLRVPQGKDTEAASLIGALMVAPVDETCASLPVLPSLAHMKAQLPEGAASALKEAPKQSKSVTDALTHAPKLPTSKAPPEPDEKAPDDEKEEPDKAEQQPKEKDVPEPKPQGKDSLEPQQQKETAELQPQKKEATEPKPNKKEITEPKPREKESLEPKQQEKELAEQKPQEKTATEPKPQQKETAELKSHEKKATEPKTQKKETAEQNPNEKKATESKPQKKETIEQKPQEKEVTEPKLQEKETAALKPQKKEATEPKPKETKIAEPKPKKEKSSELKLEKKEMAELKPQEKEVAEQRLQEKETSKPKSHTKDLPEHESGLSQRKDEHER